MRTSWSPVSFVALVVSVLAASAGATSSPPPTTSRGWPRATETTRGDITTSLHEPCDDGSAAAFVTIAGGPHAWPGGTPRLEPASGAGYADYDATAELVTFLLSHARP